MSFAFLGLKSIKSPTQIKNIPKSIIVHFDNMSIIFICLLVVCKVARRVAGNGRVYETFGISKRFPIKLQLLLIRAETLDKPLTAKCFIHDVCALHEQCTHHRRSVKMSKIQIFFKIPIVRGYIFFQRVQIPYASRYIGKALVSRKVVYREVCTEGGVSEEMSGGHFEVIDPTVGQTAKSGTDTSTSSVQAQQERYMRHICLG